MKSEQFFLGAKPPGPPPLQTPHQHPDQLRHCSGKKFPKTVFKTKQKPKRFAPNFVENDWA